VHEVHRSGVLGEELRQRVLEQSDHKLGAGHIRQLVLDERANGNADKPRLGQPLEGVEAVDLPDLALLGDDPERGAGGHPELEGHTA